MRCPACGNEQSRVVDSRTVQNGGAIRRRRECEACGRRFTTYERTEESVPMVVKRDGRREPYSRDKLLHGLTLACRKRPVSTREIEAMADAVERALAKLDKREVPSAFIGDRVMNRLRALDQIAYIRFASVYLSFDDIESFDQFLETIPLDRTPQPRNDKAPAGAKRGDSPDEPDAEPEPQAAHDE